MRFISKGLNLLKGKMLSRDVHFDLHLQCHVLMSSFHDVEKYL